MRDQTKSIESLQILRAAAAISVFAFHLFDGLRNDFSLGSANLFPLGAAGVDIFFVVSGFIIAYGSANETSSIRFFLRRIFRIAPLYYLCTLGVFLIALVAPSLLNATTANFGNLAQSLLFMAYVKESGLVQPIVFLGWTLNYEMFFYLIFAICIAAGRWRHTLCAAIICGLIFVGFFVPSESLVAKFYTSGIMLCFVFGILAFMAWRAFPDVATRLAPFRWVFVLVIGVQNFFPLPLPREWAFGLPSAFLLLSLLNWRVPQNTFWRGAIALGDASYSLYLVHPYVIAVAIKVVLPIAGLSALSIALASVTSVIGVAVASLILYRYVERPSNNWLRETFLRRRQPVVAVQTLEPKALIRRHWRI